MGRIGSEEELFAPFEEVGGEVFGVGRGVDEEGAGLRGQRLRMSRRPEGVRVISVEVDSNGGLR